MLKKLLQTNDDVSMLILRVLLGIVFIPHGMQKLLGFSGVMQMFTTQLGIPTLFAFLAIMTEILGPVGLITGLLTRVAALAIGVEMAVAVYMIHWQNGFFMNWFGNQKGEGFEYHILVIAIALVLMIGGGGKWSIDRALASK
ncbi:MAG TPA: DoxX family protein [Nitrospirota bacterium]|nr:DoxX family protein [Nitrospirota bacterium]